MPLILQSACDYRLKDKEQLLEALRLSYNYTIHNKDNVLQMVNDSNTFFWKEREVHLQELRSLHQLNLQDLRNTLQQQQSSFNALVAATVIIVLALIVVFYYLLANQAKEKCRLEDQNHQYEKDIKEKIESQKKQYENIIQEKLDRIMHLESEQEQQRTNQHESLSTSTSTVPHPQMVYAFPNMQSISYPPTVSAAAKVFDLQG